MHPRLRSLALLLVTLSLAAAAPQAQTAMAPRPTLVAPAPLKVTTPEQFFGHKIGEDYVLPDYTKFTEYVRKLDAESDRMVVQSIGKTAEGRDQLMAIITAPENYKKLDRYKEISRRLALAESRGVRISPKLAIEISSNIERLPDVHNKRPAMSSRYLPQRIDLEPTGAYNIGSRLINEKVCRPR